MLYIYHITNSLWNMLFSLIMWRIIRKKLWTFLGLEYLPIFPTAAGLRSALVRIKSSNTGRVGCTLYMLVDQHWLPERRVNVLSMEPCVFKQYCWIGTLISPSNLNSCFGTAILVLEKLSIFLSLQLTQMKPGIF